MPFTPFHLGPTLLIALLLFPSLDLASFLVSGIIVDVEPLYLMSQRAPYLHGFFHSYLGASILGVLVAVCIYSMRRGVEKVLGLFLIQQRSSFRKILFTSLLGVYSHVFLDSFLYGEMKPFYPLEFNPFLNAVSAYSIYGLCSVSFLLGLIVYAYRAVKALKSSRPIGPTVSLTKKLFVAIVIVVAVALYSQLLMSSLPFGEPKLRVNLASPPPSEVSPGDTFEIVLEVFNEGRSDLRGLAIHLEMPEGFTDSVTKTNVLTVGPASLSAYDGFGQGFVVTVSKDIPTGSYTLRVTVTADNVSPQILSPSLKVIKK